MCSQRRQPNRIHPLPQSRCDHCLPLQHPQLLPVLRRDRVLCPLRPASHQSPSRFTPMHVRFALPRRLMRRLRPAAISCVVNACSLLSGQPQHVWELSVSPQGQLRVLKFFTRNTSLNWRRCPVCRAPIPKWDGRGGGVIGLQPRVVITI